jgi:hypothetical protein
MAEFWTVCKWPRWRQWLYWKYWWRFEAWRVERKIAKQYWRSQKQIANAEKLSKK